ncbi:MAG: hypothetical protein BAA02_03680 [Paenibacillaceae bacterium ZCTH02-B3]|nr:MAG: hypothetical protein BAA02_03680 [Paenibacillaceae bacterium ZCTH02-B3]
MELRAGILKSKALKFVRNNVVVSAAIVYLLGVILVSVCAQWLPLNDPNRGSLMDSLTPPGYLEGGNEKFPLGTDMQGRDILSRIIFGARTSLGIAFTATLLAMGLGILVGIVSGYYRRLDQLFMRIADVQMAFPSIILAIALVAALGGASVTNVIIVLAIGGWIEYARVVRSQVLSLKESVLIEATRSLGAKNSRILFVHILPNVISSSVALATVQMPMFMIQEAGLSFLGLGVPLDIPSWGGMLKEGQQLIYNAWWPIVFPAAAITSVVFAGVIVGDWVSRRYEKVK